MSSFSLGSLLFRSDAAKAAKKRKPPNCVKGVLVGNSCQSKNRLKKKAEAATKTKAAAKKPAATKKAKPVAQLAVIAPPKAAVVTQKNKKPNASKDKGFPDFSKLTPVAEGAYGKVYFVGDSVFKVPKRNDSVVQVNTDREVETQRAIPGAPKIIRYDPKSKIVEMERVKGEPLFTRLKKATPAEASKLKKASLEQLSKIHQAGYIHGDYHGGNQLVSASGKIRPIDFGLTLKTDTAPGALYKSAIAEIQQRFIRTGYAKKDPDDFISFKIRNSSSPEESLKLYKTYVSQVKKML